MRLNNRECISSSVDGSCIIWDLLRGVRLQIIFAPCFFNAVSYFPEESQVLTCGTDRKVCYWEVFDGSLIREIEASQSDSINGLDISRDGQFIIVGGSDRLLKVYRYEEGDVAAVGVGHSTEINRVRISPDQKYIVSASSEGAIFMWNFASFPIGDRLLPPLFSNWIKNPWVNEGEKEIWRFFRLRGWNGEYSLSWILVFVGGLKDKVHKSKFQIGIWTLLLIIFVYTGFGMVYLSFSILYFIIQNTSKNKNDESLSAYSVFNKNVQRLEGEMDANAIDKNIRKGTMY